MHKQKTIENVEAFLKEEKSPLLRTHGGLGTERKVTDVYQPSRRPETLIVTFSDGVQTNVPSSLIVREDDNKMMVTVVEL